jgi:Tfp pilus assembly protein PilF
MNVLVVVLTLILLASVIAVVSAPLRARHTDNDGDCLVRQTDRDPASESLHQRVELETAREAKYREIRDLELDYRTGKLSTEDYEATNGTLRAEAVELLDRLQALQRDEAKPRVS